MSEGIENFGLPKILVTKIAKSAIPDNAKLQKDTVVSLVKTSTVFINYLAATAHDVALSKQYKSISVSDVLKALEMTEFVYRDNTKGDKNRKSTVDRNGNLIKGKAKEGESISSAFRSKRKGKGPLPPPFTTQPLPGAAPSISNTAGDVKMSIQTGETEDVGEVEDGRDYGSDTVDEVDKAMEYDETEEEEPLDLVPDESEELRKDVAGLDGADLGLGEG